MSAFIDPSLVFASRPTLELRSAGVHSWHPTGRTNEQRHRLVQKVGGPGAGWSQPIERQLGHTGREQVPDHNEKERAEESDEPHRHGRANVRTVKSE